MSARDPAPVTPGLLEWSRQTAGYTLSAAAEKVHQPEEKVAAWENGTEQPSLAQTRLLSELYRRPLAAFFLPVAPRDDDAMRDFRRLPEVPMGRESPELRREFRRARYRREVALEIFRTLGETVPEFSATARLDESPDSVGRRIRTLLGVSWEEQLDWPYANAYAQWTAQAEATGVLVLQATGVEIEEFRGVALYEFPLPVILVNNKDAPNGRTFTLLHELVHLLLFRGGGIAGQGERIPGEDRVEIFANAAAAAALLPRVEFLADDFVAIRKGNVAWDDQAIARAARRFKVSQEMLVRRLADLGYVTQAFYRDKRVFLQNAWRMRIQPQGGGPPPHVKSLSSAGRLFTRLVLEGYHQEKITGSDLADYLEIRLKHLPRLEQAFISRRMP